MSDTSFDEERLLEEARQATGLDDFGPSDFRAGLRALIATFEQMYGDLFMFEGERAILFDASDEIPEKALGHCIALALTYHLNKKKPA